MSLQVITESFKSLLTKTYLNLILFFTLNPITMKTKTEKTATLSLSAAKELYNASLAGEKIALKYYSEEELNAPQLARTCFDLPHISGYYIGEKGSIMYVEKIKPYKIEREGLIVFSTKVQINSAIAMAHLSQLMDQANGDWVPDWSNNTKQKKYVIFRKGSEVSGKCTTKTYHFLAFKSAGIMEDFLHNHIHMIKRYLEFMA